MQLYSYVKRKGANCSIILSWTHADFFVQGIGAQGQLRERFIDTFWDLEFGSDLFSKLQGTGIPGSLVV